MKFSATKEKLLEGLQQVQNVVSNRTTLPILSNVLLQASDGEVHLTTTDLDVGVRGSFSRAKSKSISTEKTPLPFGADKASSRFWDCRKRSFRPFRNSKTPRWSRSGRKICATV